MIDLSIIIVSYRGRKRLTMCLEALHKFTGVNFTTEIIIIDNRSDDDEINNIKERFSDFRFVLNNINGGFANGCNLGAGYAKGEFLLFLNPDTVASESEIEKLLLTAKQNSDYTILSCRQINERGKECISSGPFPQFYNLTGFQRALFGRRKPHTASLRPEVSFPDWISGSVVMINREIFNRLKGFDEDFWMYYEDVDLCRRAERTGGKIVFCTNITVEHNHGGSSRISFRTTSLTKTEVNISRHVYINKHKTGIERLLIHIFLVVNNIISLGLLAILGILFFFVPRMFARTLIFIRLTGYYIGSIFRLTWVSPRSVKYIKME